LKTSVFVVSHTKDSHGPCVMDVKRYLMTSVNRIFAASLHNTKHCFLHTSEAALSNFTANLTGH